MEYMQKGGPLMWAIFFCSVVAFAVFAERVFYFHRITIRVGEFLRGLHNLIQRRNFAEALHECAGTPGPVARVIHAALLRHNAPRSELRDIVQEAGQLEVPRLERGLTMLALIAYISPLAGLLGTVMGLIDAFTTIAAQGGFTSSTDIAAGVYSSLLTTAAGLAVCIPSAVAYGYLSARVNSFMHDMERGGIEVVNMITDLRSSTGESPATGAAGRGFRAD